MPAKVEGEVVDPTGRPPAPPQKVPNDPPDGTHVADPTAPETEGEEAAYVWREDLGEVVQVGVSLEEAQLALPGAKKATKAQIAEWRARQGLPKA